MLKSTQSTILGRSLLAKNKNSINHHIIYDQFCLLDSYLRKQKGFTSNMIHIQQKSLSERVFFNSVGILPTLDS